MSRKEKGFEPASAELDSSEPDASPEPAKAEEKRAPGYYVAPGQAVMVHGIQRNEGELISEKDAECPRLLALGYLVKA